MGDAMTRTKLLNHAGTWSLICALVLLDQTSIGATPAMAQTAEGRQIAEIVRKSEAGEQENGFCASTGWPPGDNLEWFTMFLRNARVGSWKVNAFANGNCQLDRVTLIVPENDGRCITYRLYSCTKGGTCGIGQVTDCLDRNGAFVKRRN